MGGPKYPARKRASDLSARSNLYQLDESNNTDSIASACFELIKEAQSGDNYTRFCRQAEEAYKFWYGDQWLDSDLNPSVAPSYRFRTQRDITFSTVESINGLLLDARPIPYVVADNPNDDIYTTKPRKNKDLASDFTAQLHAVYDSRAEELELEKVLLDVTITGKGVRRLFWDWHKNSIGVKQYNPVDVLIDPFCDDSYRHSAKYIVLCKEMDADDLQRKYELGKAAMRRILDKSDSNYEGYDPGILAVKRNLSPFANSYLPSSMGPARGRVRVKVYELWFLGDTLFDLEHNSQQKMNYPNGRVIVLAGDEVVHMAANPMDFVPITFFDCYSDPRDPYGFGDVHTFKHNQVSINVLLSQMIMNAILMSNSQWLYEEGALRNDWLTNEPGLAIEVPRGYLNSVQKLPSTPVDGSLLSLIRFIETNTKEVTSINETVQGAMPKSHTSGAAIEQSQSAAMIRTRTKGKHLEGSYRDQAYKEVRLIQEYYTFTDPIEKRQMDMGEWLRWDDAMRNLAVDIQIESRIDIPANLQDKMALAQQAMGAGWMDALAALEFVGFDVDERFKSKLRNTEELQAMQLELTKAQLMGQLQQAGVKYPPEDNENFIRNETEYGIGSVNTSVPAALPLPPENLVEEMGTEPVE